MDDNAILRQIESGSPVGIVERNAKVVARFYLHAIKDEVASKREGRSIYKNVDYIQRVAIGDKDFVSAPVQLADTVNFPHEWAAYQAFKNNPKTSIRCLPKLTPADFKLCEELQIPTIEDLAAADVQPELAELKAIAVAWLALASGSSVLAPAQPKPKGRPKGSKNRPKGDHENAQAVA